ncbi:MAG: hypothetical protein RIS94_2543 [Pseudomonadota bacterium]|jgi:hypothetical protein
MHRLTQADLRDLGRYPVSLQQSIVALFGVEPETCVPGLPVSVPTVPVAGIVPDNQGSGIER